MNAVTAVVMISVIIPVYNTAPWLARCLSSIRRSTYRDFEIILVDDGSTDESADICRRFCLREGRARLIRQEHAGVSAARNHGIAASRGKWLVFVDSDDVVSRDFLGLVAQERFQGQDLLLFDFAGQRKERGKQRRIRDFHSDGSGRKALYCKKKDMVSVLEAMLCMRQPVRGANTNLCSPCGRAYRSALVKEKGITFPSDLEICEDRIFNARYFLETGACAYIPKTVYYVESRGDSATHCFHPDYPRQDRRFRRKLRDILKEYGVWGRLKEAYYENVLSAMADVLVKGIFRPGNGLKKWTKYEFCQIMQRDEIYRRALRYNRRCGRMARRALLFFWSRECYGIAALICRAAFVVLERQRGSVRR